MRQFLAIDLPPLGRRSLAELQEDLRGDCPGWRWVRPESIHATVRFLGEVDEFRDARAREAWERAARAGDSFTLRLEGLGVFPPRGRPRVLWVGLREAGPGDRLRRLAESVERAAREIGFAAETRGFRPHLTLARAARSPGPVAPPTVEWIGPHAFEVEELVLFRSVLTPSGARYTALATFPLGGRQARR